MLTMASTLSLAFAGLLVACNCNGACGGKAACFCFRFWGRLQCAVCSVSAPTFTFQSAECAPKQHKHSMMPGVSDSLTQPVPIIIIIIITIAIKQRQKTKAKVGSRRWELELKIK